MNPLFDNILHLLNDQEFVLDTLMNFSEQESLAFAEFVTNCALEGDMRIVEGTYDVTSSGQNVPNDILMFYLHIEIRFLDFEYSVLCSKENLNIPCYELIYQHTIHIPGKILVEGYDVAKKSYDDHYSLGFNHYDEFIEDLKQNFKNAFLEYIKAKAVTRARLKHLFIL